jgi:hypothetical protein
LYSDHLLMPHYQEVSQFMSRLFGAIFWDSNRTLYRVKRVLKDILTVVLEAIRPPSEFPRRPESEKDPNIFNASYEHRMRRMR